MLHKSAKPQNIKLVRRVASVLFIAEGLVFVGCYGVWHKLNTDRSFRKYMHNKYPSVLNIYYSLSVKLGAPKNTKSMDIAYWDTEEK